MDEAHAQTVYCINRLLDRAQSHLQLGRPEAARTACQAVLELHPENLEATYQLARLAASEGNYAAAADQLDALKTICCEESLLREYYSYHFNAGKVERAAAYFRRVIEQYPQSTAAWYWLATACLNNNDFKGFRQAAVRLQQLGGVNKHILYDLAELYVRADLVTCAERCYEACLTLDPGNAYYRSGMANLLKKTGRADEAAVYYAGLLDGASARESNHASWTNHLMNLICTVGYTPEEIFAEHQRWGAYCSSLAVETVHHAGEKRESGKRLRIGYVSTDFCRHPVAFFIEPLLTMHDQNRFEIYLYANNEREDDITHQIRQRPCVWRPIIDKSDAEVSALIQEDAIDILVDLGGLTRKNRLPVFAFRPAPVQISWLGYAHSTGLPTIDYRLSDAVADPPGMTEHLHTEKIYRLQDCFLGYHPPINPPEIKPLSCLNDGQITFAAFNNLAKTNDQLLGWWAEILKQTPNSRLLLKDSSFARDYCFREAWLDRFAALGITSDRVELLDRSPSIHDHLSSLGRADIMLDTYPYNGTTTTSESIWMGTPVVTLAGRSHVSRVSASLLTCVGAPELIAQNPEHYIATAVALAHDRERLQMYRDHLRGMMQASPLMDFNGFARKIEAAYRDVWRIWCVSQGKE
ncbi:MAG: tetratricopeptide repeat protein [Geobacter sp.]|nr:tetratricopeptide repeat protein [Geobacter sp.]